MTSQGPSARGLGAHHGGTKVALNQDGVMDPADLGAPTLIYDGTDPDSKLAGLMYLAISMDTENPPQGFAGPNDHWHFHTNVCLAARPGGGVDAPPGTFSNANLALTCPDGSCCTISQAAIGTRANICSDVAA